MNTDLSEEISISYDSGGNLNILIPESHIRDIEGRLLLKSVRRSVSASEKRRHVSDISGEQYVFDKKGNPTAIILPIEEYEKKFSVPEDMENISEAELLPKSPEFGKLVGRGLDDIRSGRVRHWKEVWNEL